MTNYHYILMLQKQMLCNEVLEEILRERATYYSSKSKSVNFWLEVSPNFIQSIDFIKKLEKTNFFKQQKQSFSSNLQENKNSFYSALISTDKEFIQWIKLRLGYFEELEINPAFEENKKKGEYVSDGIYGILSENKPILIEKSTIKSNNLELLHSNGKFLDANILLKLYQKSLNTYNLNPFKNTYNIQKL